MSYVHQQPDWPRIPSYLVNMIMVVCLTSINLMYVRTKVINGSAINIFRRELSEIDTSSLLDGDLATDPITDYEKFEKIITKTYDKHISMKHAKSINVNTNGQMRSRCISNILNLGFSTLLHWATHALSVAKLTWRCCARSSFTGDLHASGHVWP